jgi:hypothetical protein
MRVQLALAVLLLAAGLAGCSGSPKDKVPDGPVLSVTPTTGGIRGLVVDQAVVPIQGARITISGGANATSGKDGTFNFTGLAPGDYLLQVGKPGYVAVQASATVEAGVPDPPIVKVLLQAISTAKPYVDYFKLEGFYDCSQAVFFDTDTCDWEFRTAYDVANDSAGQPPVAPRSFLHYYNTQLIDIPEDTFSIVQEGFWTDESVHLFWIMIDGTPIDSSCDCSETWANVIGGPSPLYNRLDRFTATGANNTEFRADFDGNGVFGEFPNGQTVASRGFVPFQDTPVVDGTDPNTWYSVAQNFRFTVITSLFHNTPAPDGWTFETRDQYPIG